jgi:hypothetical protein
MLLNNAMRAACLALPALGVLAMTASAGDFDRHGDLPVFLQFEAGDYRYPEASWAQGGISCLGGRSIVYHRGFRYIDPIDCEGRTFIYSGEWWWGERYLVYVDSRSGHIRGVAPG